MATLVAIGIMIVAACMLVAYYAGHAVGHREGFDAGRSAGKREGSKRAYAVGYDRGRHDRQTTDKESEDSQGSQASGLRWAWPLVLSLIAVIAATIAWRTRIDS